MDRVQFGKRATVYKGSVNLEMILQEERTEKYIKRVQDEAEKQGEMLVMGKIPYLMPLLSCWPFIVSGSNELRDRLQDLVHGYLDKKVRLLKLEY